MSLTITRKVSVSGGTVLRAANNLGDVGDMATAQSNLGIPQGRNALAPAQALSGDGTGKATFAVTLGSGDFSVALVASQASTAAGYLLQRSSGTAPALYTGGDGKLYYNNGSTDVFYASFAELDTPVFITLVRSSGLTTMRFNGAVVAGPTADATNYSGVLGYIGGSASGTFFTGTLRLLGIENRALSAAGVLSVYQTGSFPASDFGASGAPAGTTVTAGAFVAGKKYRIVSVGTTSFTAIGASANTVGVEFVATGVGSGTGTALAIGLLVAPDPAQLGSGDYWYDVSGNGCTITKPASGVDWVNRWSGTLPGPATVAGNLTATGVGVFGGGSAGNGVVANVPANSNHFVWQVGGVNKMVQYIDASNKLVWYQGGTLMSLADTGALAIANTSAIKGVRTATGTLTNYAIAADSNASFNVTVTGAVVEDSVTVNTTDGNSFPDGFSVQAYVSAANTVAVRMVNVSSSSKNTGTGTYRVTVFSF